MKKKMFKWILWNECCLGEKCTVYQLIMYVGWTLIRYFSTNNENYCSRELVLKTFQGHLSMPCSTTITELLYQWSYSFRFHTVPFELNTLSQENSKQGYQKKLVFKHEEWYWNKWDKKFKVLIKMNEICAEILQS